nr:hypothetical protein [Tanacetum cinerariifolium]
KSKFLTHLEKAHYHTHYLDFIALQDCQIHNETNSPSEQSWPNLVHHSQSRRHPDDCKSFEDRPVKEVLMMVLVMHTEEADTVLHIKKTGTLMRVVAIDVGGITADVVDKINCSSNDVQSRQVDLRSAHALTKLHWHDTHVNPNRHEVDQR